MVLKNNDVKAKLFFTINFLLILSLFINRGGAIRILSYINILFLIYLFIESLVVSKVTPKVTFHILIPFFFIVLDMLAMNKISFTNDYMKLVTAAFFGYGIYQLVKLKPFKVNQIMDWIFYALVSYTLIEFFAIFIFNKPNGTTSNPHQLALYSAYAILISIFCYFKTSPNIRNWLAPVILCLLFFVLLTSSRPTWISLFLCGVAMLFFIDTNKKKYTVAGIVLMPIFLYVTNLENFGARMQSLIANITTEERVIIWSDAWRMQMDSSWYEWLVGHGLESFEQNFIAYSRFHLEGNDFTMPHNSFLEVLYLSGVTGVIVYVTTYIYMFYHLIIMSRINSKYKNLCLLLLAMLITNLVMGLITIKYFTHLSTYFVAFILAMIVYVQTSKLEDDKR
jgi:O-antigen ligase